MTTSSVYHEPIQADAGPIFATYFAEIAEEIIALFFVMLSLSRFFFVILDFFCLVYLR